MALTQPALIPQPWGSDGQIGTIPQDTADFGKASWAKGFPVETAQPLTEGGVPPSYLDFQGVLNALSAHAVFKQSGAQYVWNASLDYPAGAIVIGSNGSLYQALEASGPGESAGARNPTTQTAYWGNCDFSNVVHTTGNETVEGVKTFTGSPVIANTIAALTLQDSALVKGTAPDATEAFTIQMNASEGVNSVNRFGAFITTVNPENLVRSALVAYKPENGVNTSAAVDVYYPASGSPYATAPSTPSGSTGTQIVTADFLLAKDYLPKAGGVMTGGITLPGETRAIMGDKTKRIVICSGTDDTTGAMIFMNGSERATNAGWMQLFALKGSTFSQFYGTPEGSWFIDGKTVLTTADSATIAGYAMPSSRYVDLTLGANGASYTAPANGWVAFSKLATASLQSISIICNGIQTLEWSCGTNLNLFVYLPVKKGDTYSVQFSANGALNYFRFIYAEGAE